MSSKSSEYWVDNPTGAYGHFRAKRPKEIDSGVKAEFGLLIILLMCIGGLGAALSTVFQDDQPPAAIEPEAPQPRRPAPEPRKPPEAFAFYEPAQQAPEPQETGPEIVEAASEWMGGAWVRAEENAKRAAERAEADRKERIAQAADEAVKRLRELSTMPRVGSPVRIVVQRVTLPQQIERQVRSYHGRSPSYSDSRIVVEYHKHWRAAGETRIAVLYYLDEQFVGAIPIGNTAAKKKYLEILNQSEAL